MRETDYKVVEEFYRSLPERVSNARKAAGRPLTLTEKILMAHLAPLAGQTLIRKTSAVTLAPDRVAMQDATAQMAMLQFMLSGRSQTAVPTTIHCDHLIQAYQGAKSDLLQANHENDEVYQFLRSASARSGIGFWKPGSGIIHQVVLENYAFPGGMMIGTDSHTPNAGGLGMIAVGVGGSDAMDVMVGEPFALRWPGVIGIHLKGQLHGWTSAKDVILKVMEILTVSGGTHHIVEYFGDGADRIGCTGKATICNMGAEHGATTSIFPYDANMAAYLRATGRERVAKMADGASAHLRPDPEVLADPKSYYDRVVEIDLATLEPYVCGPHSPDVARPISQLAKDVAEKGYPSTLTYTLIGSCTNSSYEDMGRAAAVAKQALLGGLPIKTPLMVTPGSEQIFQTIKRDGLVDTFEKAGATVLANACGPCIGQWKRDDIKKGEKNSILNSYNRNFRGRNDGNAETLSFIASPEIVTALSFAGNLSFNPLTDTLQTPSGKPFQFTPPSAPEFPAHGFIPDREGFVPPPPELERAKANVLVNPTSERLALLEPFSPWNGSDFLDLPILAKTRGKCTTDHISAAGPWLRYRGHLDRISDNLLIGATNDFTGEIGKGRDGLDNRPAVPFPQIARNYKAHGLGWIIVGDENYGEGSSREHAAMSPRHLGGKAVLVKSFARIHETNLKKQGVLPLTFANPSDYARIREDDRISILGLAEIEPGKPLTVRIRHADNTEETFLAHHTLTREQIGYFRAGSALNKIRESAKLN